MNTCLLQTRKLRVRMTIPQFVLFTLDERGMGQFAAFPFVNGVPFVDLPCDLLLGTVVFVALARFLWEGVTGDYSSLCV